MVDAATDDGPYQVVLTFTHEFGFTTTARPDGAEIPQVSVPVEGLMDFSTTSPAISLDPSVLLDLLRRTEDLLVPEHNSKSMASFHKLRKLFSDPSKKIPVEFRKVSDPRIKFTVPQIKQMVNRQLNHDEPRPLLFGIKPVGGTLALQDYEAWLHSAGLLVASTFADDTFEGEFAARVDDEFIVIEEEVEEKETGPVFVDLPAESLKLILTYAGDVPSLLNCERACKKLRYMIADDEVWSSLPGASGGRRGEDPRLPTHREVACVSHNLCYIRKKQETTSNILLDVFEEGSACASWKEIARSALTSYLPQHWPGPWSLQIFPRPLCLHHHMSLRGDTMGTLLELLQTFLITRFQRAHQVILEAEASRENVYPSVKAQHLRLQDVVGQATDATCSHQRDITLGCKCLFREYSNEEQVFANALISPEIRDKIIRGAAFRAGVVRLENDVYNQAWGALVKLIALLFYPAYLNLAARSISENDTLAPTKQNLVAPGETIRNFAPHSTGLPQCLRCGECCFVHTAVPRQLEDAASQHLPTMFPCRVYNVWLTDGPWSEEAEAEEIAAAEAEYTFSEFVVADSDFDEDDGSESSYSLPSSGDSDIYSDDEVDGDEDIAEDDADGDEIDDEDMNEDDADDVEMMDEDFFGGDWVL